MEWLLCYVGDQIDPGQYGGFKGCSTTHYLVELVNFVLYNQDLKNPKAVLAAMIDYSKAFNKVNHNLIITILSNMGVPGWLLRLVISFLTDRDMILKYKGCSSERKKLPGGGPQGSRLGMFIFLILINFAGPQNTSHTIGEKVTQPMRKRQPIKSTQMKFIDDMTMMESLNLRDCVISDPDPSPPQPPQYRCRTAHLLQPEKTFMQKELNKLSEFSINHEMSINKQKSKVMIFNTARKFDCLPNLSIQSDNLEVVESMKLLGVIVQSDMRWGQNTEYVCQKGYSRLWMLRRLKGLGASISELLDVYKKQVLCVLEMTVAAWTARLTLNEKRQIERVQKCAFSSILGLDYGDYKTALYKLQMKKLEDRRVDISRKFAHKASKHEKHKNWFSLSEEPVQRATTRYQKPVTKYIEPVARTDRFRDSLPYLTRLLNE